MNNSPLISIIIPVYNRERLVIPAIESAIAQTYQNIEIIIVDNNSTDLTWEVLVNIAKKDNRIRVHQNQKNLGPVRNWKVGIEMAKGKFAQILWSDDMLSYNCIEENLKLLTHDTAFVINPIKYIDEEGKTLHIKSYGNKNEYKYNEYILDILIWNRNSFPVSPGCALFRCDDLLKNLMVEIPNLDNLTFSRYGAGNDLLLFLLAAKDYKKIAYCKDTYVCFRKHGDSISLKMQNELNIYYDWAKWFFIKNHFQKVLKKYKTIIFLRKITNAKYTELYQSIPVKLSLSFLVKFFVYKMFKN